jgi:hypothetical protein
LTSGNLVYKVLDLDAEVKPVFCDALRDIDTICGGKLDTCFTKADTGQMMEQHIDVMKKYFTDNLVSGLDLTDCNVKEEEEEEDEEDENNVVEQNDSAPKDEDEKEVEKKDTSGTLFNKFKKL